MPVDFPLAAYLGIAPAVWTVGSVALAVILLTAMIAWGRVQPFLAFVIVASAPPCCSGSHWARSRKPSKKASATCLAPSP